VLPGDIDQQEMIASKKSAVLVDGIVLNGPTTDVKAGEKFVEEACRLIMEEVVLKATDVKEKVRIKTLRSPRTGKDRISPFCLAVCKGGRSTDFPFSLSQQDVQIPMLGPFPFPTSRSVYSPAGLPPLSGPIYWGIG
jgi:hypothetical protein